MSDAPWPRWRLQAAWGADVTADPATWTWSDISSRDVRAESPFKITQGKTDFASQPTPATLSFSLNNPLGWYTPDHPGSPYYPWVGENTPLRLYADGGSGENLRGTFLANSWTPRWDSTMKIAMVDVSASGQLRRLAQGSAPVKSAIYREITVPPTVPVFYWPCEDMANATQFTEVYGGPALIWTDLPPTLATAGPAGSQRLPKLANDASANGLYVRITPYTSPSPNVWTVNLVFNMPQTPSGPSPIIDLRTTSGTIKQWRWTIFPLGGTDTMNVEAFDNPGSHVVNDAQNFAVGSFTEPYGRDLFVEFQVGQSGANIAWQYKITDSLTAASFTRSGSFVGTTGNISEVSVPSGYDHSNMVFGHCAIFNAATAGLFDVSSLNGHAGETAATRMTRLLGDDNVPFTVIGDPTLTQPLGPQTTASLMSLLRDAEAAEGGSLYDGMAGEEILRTRASRYNQTAQLTASLSGGQLAEPFQPAFDDLRRRNDWTVSRVNGSFGRFQDTADQRRGLYDDSVTLNVDADRILVHQAGWRVNLGTVKGLRYSSLSFKFYNHRELLPSWLGIDIGDLIVVTNLPATHPPGNLELLLEGYTEVIGFNEWNVTANLSPYAPWRVFEVANSAVGRLDSDTATLTSSATATATSLTVTDTNPWTTTALFPADFPLDINIDGEQVTVTAITGSVPTYTFTVTRAVNGISKAHSAGASVALWRPGVLAL